jgi:putative lipoprotein
MTNIRTVWIWLAVLLLGFVGTGSTQAPPPNVAQDLGGTSWQLVKFQGSDDRTLAPDDKSKYTIAFENNGGVSVRIDCNRGRGTWKSSGPNQLEFGPLALTRAMCPPAPLTERIAKDWQYVRSYILKDGYLFLSLMADGGIYEFEPNTSGKLTPRQVKGTATYRERMALPPTAVFEATLEDVSRADAPAEVIGQAHTEHPGNPPISFEITYDPSRIDPSHHYFVRARILVDGKVLFTTDRKYPVLGAGQCNEVKLLLRRAKASSPAKGGGIAETQLVHPSVENTDWKLTRLGEESVAAASQEKEPHFILNSENHRVTGSGGCNRLTGSYELKGDQLKFNQMAGTMMACIEGMDTEKAFLDALTQTKTWKISGQQLELFDAGGKLLATFDVRHPQ